MLVFSLKIKLLRRVITDVLNIVFTPIIKKCAPPGDALPRSYLLIVATQYRHLKSAEQ